MVESHIKCSLCEFFHAMERRLAQRFPYVWPSFQIRICNRVIELCFSTIEQMEKAIKPLRGFKVETDEIPDAIFKYCVDDCTEYFNPEHADARWQITDESYSLINMPGEGLSGKDGRNNKFFTIVHSGLKKDPLLYAHPLLESFESLGEKIGLMIMHSAVVGTNGKGVIIAGYGGAGKSTLAVSCLLAGLDFVSDDYAFFTMQDMLEAFPIYTSVCLNKDMLQFLKPDMPVIDEYRVGKYVLDASNYAFSSHLAIYGIVLPIIPLCTHIPEIVHVSGVNGILKITLSTVFQTFGFRAPELMRTIMSRLKGLPVFEFRQCRDYRRNAEYLREFIKKEL